MRTQTIFSLFFLFLVSNLIAQNENPNTGKLDTPLVVVVDSLEKFNIYHKRKFIILYDGKKYKEKAFYINIPKNVKFKKAIYNVFSSEFIFSSDEGETIIIKRYAKKNNNLTTIKYFPCSISSDTTDIDNHLEKQCEVILFVKDEYIIYCYNVHKKNFEVFKQSIMSLRSKL